MWSFKVGIKYVAYLPCLYYKVKSRIQGEKCHTLRSRCACVWNIWFSNLILLCSLKHISLVETSNNCKSRGYLSLFLWRTSLYPLFSILRTSLCPFFQLLFFLSFFFSLLILHSPMSLFCNKTFQERYSQELGAFIWWTNLSSIFLCSPPV